MSSGILAKSMRENYETHGVDEYYRKVSASYRNPHFPAIKHCLYLWLNKWWEREGIHSRRRNFRIFDMACGSGEATEAVLDWQSSARMKASTISTAFSVSPDNALPAIAGRKTPWQRSSPAISEDQLIFDIYAADPFTAEAYTTRTGRPCSPLSFQDIASGPLTELHMASEPTRPEPERGTSEGERDDKETAEPDSGSFSTMDMVICSFALHLLEDSSQLWALLSELSWKATWLIVLEPHKKPEIKEGWGWTQWNFHEWRDSIGAQGKGIEILEDRVHCRIYRSLNI